MAKTLYPVVIPKYIVTESQRKNFTSFEIAKIIDNFNKNVARCVEVGICPICAHTKS